MFVLLFLKISHLSLSLSQSHLWERSHSCEPHERSSDCYCQILASQASEAPWCSWWRGRGLRRCWGEGGQSSSWRRWSAPCRPPAPSTGGLWDPAPHKVFCEDHRTSSCSRSLISSWPLSCCLFGFGFESLLLLVSRSISSRYSVTPAPCYNCHFVHCVRSYRGDV